MGHKAGRMMFFTFKKIIPASDPKHYGESDTIMHVNVHEDVNVDDDVDDGGDADDDDDDK